MKKRNKAVPIGFVVLSLSLTYIVVSGYLYSASILVAEYLPISGYTLFVILGIMIIVYNVTVGLVALYNIIASFRH